MSESCSICGGGPVHTKVEQTLVSFRGYVEPVNLHYLECASCSSDFAGEQEMRLNKDAVRAFRDRVSQRLDAHEDAVRRARKPLSALVATGR